MNRNKKILSVIVVTLVIVLNASDVYAHSGRTDSSGGHRDKNNVSGLGSYHYHHGMGAHLRPNGVCPYSGNNGSTGTNNPPVLSSTPKRSITFISTPSDMKVGEEKPINWNTSNEFEKYQVEWITSDISIATVSALGVIKAHNEGNVRITAKLDNAEKSFSLTVSEVEIESLQVTNKLSKLEVGAEHGLIYRIVPENATNKEITWESTNKDVATVSSKGLIMAHSPGFTTIQIKSTNGFVEYFDLEVFEIKPTDICTNYETIEIFLGESINLDIAVLPDDATYNSVEWVISEEGYFEYINNQITAIAPGSSSILLSVGDLVKEIPIEVKYIPVEGVYVELKSFPFKLGKFIQVGSTFTPVVKVYPENATNSQVTFSSNGGKIRVNKNTLEVIGEGNIELFVKAGEIEEIIEFSVIDFNRIRNGLIIVISAFTVGGTGIYVHKRRRRNDFDN